MAGLVPRIVTPGVVPVKSYLPERWYTAKCNKCHCVFEYTKSMHIEFDFRGNYYIVCPQKGCCNTIKFK